MPQALTIPQSSLLPDNAAYTNRFQVRSQSTGNIYTVAQSKKGKWWSCSCKGWIRHKHCKHLRELGLPGNYQPLLVSVNGNRVLDFVTAPAYHSGEE